ncbi:hypothetical protein Mapa_002249 [Marchantia paleacea]|nr:hypothetical protein Mapa_002249 [Marchantia paleacea]
MHTLTPAVPLAFNWQTSSTPMPSALCRNQSVACSVGPVGSCTVLSLLPRPPPSFYSSGLALSLKLQSSAEFSVFDFVNLSRNLTLVHVIELRAR